MREVWNFVRKPQIYRFEYLRRHDGGVFLGLKGPRGGIRSFPLTAADMARLTEAYSRCQGDRPDGGPAFAMIRQSHQGSGTRVETIVIDEELRSKTLRMTELISLVQDYPEEARRIVAAVEDGLRLGPAQIMPCEWECGP